MTNYPAVLTANYPDAIWSLTGDTYAGLDWIGPGDKPTKDELDAAWPTVEYQQTYAAVENARRAAYATESDPLFFEWQRGDGTEQAWLDAVAAVKAAHPYPPAP